MKRQEKPGASRSKPTLVTVIRIAVTAILGVIGAAAGFTHTHDWAVLNGQTGWIAWADAVVIEGMAVVAGFELHHDRHRAGYEARKLSFPMVVLVASLVLQMTAQVALAPRTLGGWVAAGMPALGFLVVVKLLMRRTPDAPVNDSREAPRRHVSDSPPTPPPPRPMPAEQTSKTPAPSGLLAKLPAGVRKDITTATEQAHAAGKPVTADDLTARVSLPDSMVTTLVTELNAQVNGHPVLT